MNRSTGVLLFIGWATVVSAACLGIAYPFLPVLSSIVLPIAWLALVQKSALSKTVTRGDAWVAFGVVAGLLGLLLLGALSGGTNASNKWFQVSPFRPYFALLIWLAYMFAGYRTFRARYFQKADHSSVGV